MAISFNSIPLDIRTPGSYVEFDNSRAVQGLTAQPHVALIVAQKLSGGSATADELTYIASPADAIAKAGEASIGAQMAAAFKAIDPLTELWAVFQDDDAGGTEAVGDIEFTGSVNESGEIALYIGGRRVPVPVTDGDSLSAVVTEAVSRVNDHPDMPVIASDGGSTAVPGHKLTLTARHTGTLGNEIDIRISYNRGESLPDALGAAITAMASGATDPAVTAAIASMGDTQFHTVVTGYQDTTNLGELETEMDRRSGPMVQIEGLLFVAKHGTQGTLTTYGNGFNSQFLSVMGAGESPSLPWEWAARVAALDAFQTQVDPARPRQTLDMGQLKAPIPSEQFTRAERQLLLTDGISTYTVGGGGAINVERLITTFQTNAAGLPDTSYLDVTTMRTLFALRFTFRARMAQRYPRHKLRDDGAEIPPGQPIVTPSTIRAEIISLFRSWEAQGWVENIEQFQNELLVERDPNDPNRVNVILPPDLINQLRAIGGSIQFLL